jgi:hypothetical protein
MTTERQLAANRRNAQHSTDPRTARGKAIASRNSTRHGLHARAAPTIPRLESPAAWEQHRAATIGGLAPATPVEEALAERIALILWRLDRVARYEQSVATRAQQRAPDDLADEYDEDEIEDRRARLAAARRCLSALTRFRLLPSDAPLTGHEADAVIVSVAWRVEGFDLHSFAVRDLLEVDDIIADVPGWTVGRVQQVVDAIAASAERDPGELVSSALVAARAWHNRQRAAHRRIARELAGLRRERILPQAADLDQVIRFEGHLTRQLNQTLGDLRQLQRHRQASRPRPPCDQHTSDHHDPSLPLPGELS